MTVTQGDGWVRRWLNRPAAAGNPRDRACQTFGEPWLSPVLRALAAVDVFGTARDTARADVTKAALLEVEPVLRAAVARCWESAVAGQRIHAQTASAASSTPALVDRVAALHRELEHEVDSVWAMIDAAAELISQEAVPARRDPERLAAAERLRALALAMAEIPSA